MIAAVNDPEARARAVSALRSSEVWAATWPTDPATLRTLTNSNGVTALAVFSDEAQLQEASMRYGWLGIDGRVPRKRLHMSECVRFAKQHHAQLVVVDIASEHALELDEGEMELVSALPSHRPPSYQGLSPVLSSRPPPPSGSTRPGAASGRPPADSRIPASRTDVAPVTKSSHPPAGPSIKPTKVVPDNAEDPQSLAATFGAVAHTGVLLGLVERPSEDLYDSLSGVLRDYLEVEWGCLLQQVREDGTTVPSIAVRVDPSFRKNVDEIVQKLEQAASALGTPYAVVLLETPEEMKNARQRGRPFYPWRKK
jgi:hypothetical protein